VRLFLGPTVPLGHFTNLSGVGGLTSPTVGSWSFFFDF
jgi:hypothetical protein